MMPLPLPLLATIGGVDVVIVSAAEYARLSQSGDVQAIVPTSEPTRQAMTAARLVQEMRFRPGGRPVNTVLQDEEVARFLIENMGRMKNIALSQACQDRFGTERSPSASRIANFLKAVRTWFEEHPEVQA